MDARNRAIGLLVALALAGCGGGTDAASAPEPTLTPTATPTAASEPTPAPGKCDEVKYKPTETAEFTHPASNFYEPDAGIFPAKADLDHLMLHDNAVVVTYAADTPKKTRERLYEWTYAD